MPERVRHRVDYKDVAKEVLKMQHHSLECKMVLTTVSVSYSTNNRIYMGLPRWH